MSIDAAVVSIVVGAAVAHWLVVASILRRLRISHPSVLAHLQQPRYLDVFLPERAPESAERGHNFMNFLFRGRFLSLNDSYLNMLAGLAIGSFVVLVASFATSVVWGMLNQFHP